MIILTKWKTKRITIIDEFARSSRIIFDLITNCQVSRQLVQSGANISAVIRCVRPTVFANEIGACTAPYRNLRPIYAVVH